MLPEGASLADLAEGEGKGLDAGVEEGDLEGAVGDGAGLADELYTRCCERVPSPSTSLPWASPGGCPSMKTRHRTGVPGAVGPMTRLRSRAWKRQAICSFAAFSVVASSSIVQSPDRAHWLRPSRAGTA